MLTFFCFSVACLGFFANIARSALDAADRHQAFLCAYHPTMEFVRVNDGDWPASWDDLALLGHDCDYDWVAQHIEYDFNANPAELAKLTPETFTAIRHRRPCYDSDVEIQAVIDLLSKFHESP